VKLLITGAAGRIGTVLRAGLRAEAQELRLPDAVEPPDVRAPETYVAADLTDAGAVDRAVQGVDAVVHLGAVPDEAPFDRLAGPNLHGTFHVFDACRRFGARRVVFASSNHATGMYPVGTPLDSSQPPRPDGLYGASKVWGEALGRMFAERFGLEVVCLRIGSFRERPTERRELATWLSHADAVRLVRAALTAPDVGFEIVYGVSRNTRAWWPLTGALGYEPQDDAEAYAAEVIGADGEPDPDDPMLRYLGGQFTLPDYDADNLAGRS
jgi:uronate dehydrogenase